MRQNVSLCVQQKIEGCALALARLTGVHEEEVLHSEAHDLRNLHYAAFPPADRLPLFADALGELCLGKVEMEPDIPELPPCHDLARLSAPPAVRNRQRLFDGGLTARPDRVQNPRP
jgi:hypothetical protein